MVDEQDRCQWGRCLHERVMLPEGYKARHCADHYEQLQGMAEGRRKAYRAKSKRYAKQRYDLNMATYQARMAIWQPIATVLQEYIDETLVRGASPTKITYARELFDKYKPQKPKEPEDKGA